MAKCIYCNSELEVDDVLDIECEDDQVRERVVGYCERCEKNFMWDNIYTYQKYENLEESEEEEEEED